MRLLIALALLAGCEKKTEQASPPPPTPVVEQPPGAAPKTPAVAASNLPDECNAYRRAIDGLATCEKFPQQSVDSLKQSFDAMSKSWGENQSMSAAARTAMAEACKQGTDAVKQARSAMCGVEQPPAELAADLPRECEDYRKMTNLVVQCEKLPLAVRNALRQAFEQMSKSWAQQRSFPPEARRALGEGCKQATVALKQVAADSCDLEKPE